LGRGERGTVLPSATKKAGLKNREHKRSTKYGWGGDNTTRGVFMDGYGKSGICGWERPKAPTEDEKELSENPSPLPWRKEIKTRKITSVRPRSGSWRPQKIKATVEELPDKNNCECFNCHQKLTQGAKIKYGGENSRKKKKGQWNKEIVGKKMPDHQEALGWRKGQNVLPRKKPRKRGGGFQKKVQRRFPIRTEVVQSGVEDRKREQGPKKRGQKIGGGNPSTTNCLGHQN